MHGVLSTCKTHINRDQLSVSEFSINVSNAVVLIELSRNVNIIRRIKQIIQQSGQA